MTLKVGSLFAGIGAFDLGFERAGMATAWQVEIDPEARSVLRRHFPHAQQHEDVRTVGAHNLQPVDVICGGFPCQDLSVAGKRAGLAGQRSGLFYEMTRIVDELKPTYVVWENVPGLLSANGGRDFFAVLAELARVGYDGAWTCLDSAFFGVAQQRRRIFGVFTRRDSGAQSGAEILSFAARLSRDLEAGSAPGEAAPSEPDAAAAAGGTARRNPRRAAGNRKPSAFKAGDSAVAGTAGPIGSNQNGGLRLDLESSGAYIPDVSPTVTSKWAKGTGGPSGDEAQNLIAPTLTAPESRRRSVAGRRQDGGRTDRLPMVASALTASYGTHGGHSFRGDKHDPIVDAAQAWESRYVRNGRGAPSDKVPPLKAQSGQTGKGDGAPLVGVRRLTPVECERLQGFPDNWTARGAQKERMSDSARYRMCGNAVTVSVAQWLGRRIVAAVKK